jgi:hypothetical protein
MTVTTRKQRVKIGVFTPPMVISSFHNDQFWLDNYLL